MKSRIIYILAALCVFGKFSSQSFTPNQTYTYSRTYLEPVTYNTSNPNSNNNAKQVQSVQYTDGLGRPTQDIAIGSTYGGNDMVSAYFYDPATGRQTKQYLPVTKASGSGAMQTVSEADINSYYGVANAFAEVKTEDSPLSRPVETAAPGDAWKMSGGKTKKTDYLFIGQDEMKKYKAFSDDDETVFQPTVTQTENYAKGSLHKIVSTDEDGNVSIVYKNSLGQTLVTRQENGTEKLDTHYLYNQYGQLVMIVPPKASALGTLNQTAKDQLCYVYRYDAKGRLVEKKLPGKGKEEMVYNKRDQLILYQDARLKSGNSNNGIVNSWVFTKYDKYGRVLYTGLYQDSSSRVAIQNYADVLTGNNAYEERTDAAGSFSQNGIVLEYTKTAYPTSFLTVLSVNYYDYYPAGTPAKSSLITETSLSSDNLAGQSTKTLPTASYVKNISDDKWTKTYYWYDQRGRSIGAQEINHLGGTTVTHTELDWAGITKKVETSHQRTSLNTPILVKERFVYNDRNYLQEHYHQVNSNPEELLAKYTYNELGQVTNKQVGNNLQSIDYSYNIRGWLTKVNDPASLNGKLFAYELKYNNPANTSLASARYNGNITEVDWRSTADNTRRRYGYMYDGNNRLTKANYQEPDHTVPSLKYYDEEVSYDLNGNIATLKRNGKPMKGTTPGVVDNLTYFYDGNRLTSITDASANRNGYPGGGLANAYDSNGNMTSMPDKGIPAIGYNFLNLQESLVQNTTQTQYYYRADGVKLKKVFILSSQTIKTEYLDGFVYTTPYSGALKTAVEADTEIAKEAASAGQAEAFTLAEKQLSSDPVDQAIMQPYFFPTAEGFYDYENKRYIYQYKDHLGNVRISYAKNTATGVVEYLNGNNYYPFGLNFINSGEVTAVYNPSANYANYKYNQKELQETGAYDYGWRQYMPDVGRWFGVDKLAESYLSTSPYAYVMNNPIMMYDPDGRISMDWINSFYNNSQNGYNTTWTNNGSGFSNNWGGMMDYGANPTNFGSIFAGGMSGGGEAYIRIPEVVLSGQGNTKTWNRIANYEANMNSLYNGISGVSSSIFHSFNPFFGKNGPEPGGGGLIMMDSIWDVFGIALANSKPENKYAALALGAVAIVASKGRATDDFIRVYRAVDDIELASIRNTEKFLIKNGGTEAKYFANSVENAHKFGQQLYPNGYTIVEGRIYNSNNPMKYWSPGTDQIGAFIFHQKILQAVKPVFP